MPIINKKELVEYIKYSFLEYKGHTITPIKLQKTLYFLYAFWAKYVLLAKNGQKTENDFQDQDEQLFEANFYAWAYGPVDDEVYRSFKSTPEIDHSKVDMFVKNTAVEVKEFVDSFAIKLFNTSDFGLVDLSHRDECWIKHYRSGVSSKIEGKEIREEYGAKS